MEFFSVSKSYCMARLAGGVLRGEPGMVGTLTRRQVRFALIEPEARLREAGSASPGYCDGRPLPRGRTCR